jgi:hypothetical protein
MDPTVLRDHLTQLHEELKAAPHVDAAGTQLLGEIMEDIKELMARSSRADGGAFADPDAARTSAAPLPTRLDLPERLEKIAVLFEVDHPTLAASSRRLVDLLGKVGL